MELENHLQLELLVDFYYLSEIVGRTSIVCGLKAVTKFNIQSLVLVT